MTMNPPLLARRASLLLALWLVAILVTPARTHAQDVDRFTVTATEDLPDADLADDVCDADPGPEVRCTLRAAIMQANVNPGRQTVLLRPTVYRLTVPGAREFSSATGDLNILQDLSIELAPPPPGMPPSRLPATIDATGLGDRVMFLARLSPSTEMAVSIRAVQIIGGDLSGVDINNDDPIEDAGGGIFINQGVRATLVGVTIRGNKARFGGGIFVGQRATLDLFSSRVSDNEALERFPGTAGAGGGILAELNIDTPFALRLHRATISGNRAAVDGGWCLPLRGLQRNGHADQRQQRRAQRRRPAAELSGQDADRALDDCEEPGG
jgi:hypothetical protein